MFFVSPGLNVWYSIMLSNRLAFVRKFLVTNNPNYTNRDNLMKRAYVDERHLEVRVRTHEQFTVPQFDFHDWVVSQHQGWSGNEWVLDIGCGQGNYFNSVLARIPNGLYVAADLSIGMLHRAMQNPYDDRMEFLVQDAQGLAFRDNMFDVVLANHMLYHVPDLHQALDEIHRILKPDGVLLTAVNSQFTMYEFKTLSRRALTLLGHTVAEENETISKEGYTLENASSKLSRHFRGVVRYEVPSALVFHEPEPVIEYIDSTRPLAEGTLPAGITWDDYMTVMASQIDRLINHFGELVINKLSGVIIATDKGGFAQEFFNMLDQH